MSSNITDLEVTYGSALAPPKFHRCVTKEGHGADINKGNGSPVYLWYKPGNTAPIVALEVIYDDEPVPEGFTKLSKDLTKGVDSKVYLCYRPRQDGDTDPPLTEIRVLYNEETAEEEFEKVPRSLNRADVFLWFKRRAEGDVLEEGPKWTSDMLRVGDWFDCKDSVGRWSVSRVVDMTDTHLTVSYKGWSDRYNESLPKTTSDRFAELGKYTAGVGTQGYKAQGQEFNLDLGALDVMAKRIHDWIAGDFPEEARDNFYKLDLPMILETCLSSRVAADIRGTVNSFTKNVHDFVVHYLKMDEPLHKTVILHFRRLFLDDDRCNFFFMHYGGTAFDAPEAPEINGDHARLPAGGASRYFVENMNHFGDIGGYELLVERLQWSDPPLPLDEAGVYTDLLWNCKYCYTEKWAREVFPRVQTALLNRIKALTPEELKDLDRNLLSTMLRKLDGLLKVLSTNYGSDIIGPDGDEILEGTHLAIAKRLLLCPYFNQRLKGLSDIKDMVERVLEKERRRHSTHSFRTGGQRSSYYGYHPPKPTKWLDSEKMSTWLAENSIMELCLGAKVDGKSIDLHVEMVKRLPEIAAFLAMNDCINGRHLELLWTASVGTRDQMKHACYDIIGKLSTALSVPLLDELFERIASLEPEAYEAVTLEMIKEFTENALDKVQHEFAGLDPEAAEAERTKRGYGLTLFWNLIVSPDAHPPEVGEQALGLFIETLKVKHATEQLQHYAFQCMENLKSGVAVAQSLRIAKQLVESLPHYSHTGASMEFREGAVKVLQERYSVVSLLIEDIHRYKVDALSVAAKSGIQVPATEPTGGADVVLLDGVSHSEQLAVRLDFLNFVVVEDPDLTLDFDAVKRLWDECTQANITGDEKELFMDWLHRSGAPADTGTHHVVPSAFADGVLNQVFTELVCSDALHPAALGPKGFEAFEAVFRAVNFAAGHLTSTGDAMTVTSIDLQGLSFLWNIALQAANASVVTAASTFLIALYVQVAPAASKNKRDVWASFVESTMDRIAEALAAVDAAPAGADGAATRRPLERSIEVCMSLLRQFLDEVENAGRRRPSAARMALSVHVRGAARATILRPDVTRATTLGDLREEVAKALSHPADALRIENMMNHPLPAESDNKTLPELGVQQAVYAIPLQAPAADTAGHVDPRSRTEPGDADRRYPREMLSNSADYFDLLFRLLALHRESIVNDSWLLLQELPTNAGIQDQIHTLMGTLTSGGGAGSCAGAGGDAASPAPAAAGGDADSPVPWATLLDGAAPLKLLYSLEIVDKLVSPGSDLSESERADQSRWCAAFLGRGGYEHLLSIVMSPDVETWLEATLPKTCLALLLKLVNFFTVDRRSAGAVSGAVDTPALSARLLTIVQAAVTAARDNVVETGPTDDGTAEIKNEGAAAQAKNSGGTSGGAGTSAGADPMEDDEEDDMFRDFYGLEEEDAFGSSAASKDDASKSKKKTETRYTMTKEAEVIRHALNLLVVVVVKNPAELTSVLASEGLAATFVEGLLQSPDPSVRGEMEKGLHQLCFKLGYRSLAASLAAAAVPATDEEDAAGTGAAGAGDEPVVPDSAASVDPSDAVAAGRQARAFILKLLLDSLPKAYEHPDTCQAFFSLVYKLIKLKPASEKESLDASAVVSKLCGLISDHPVVEVSAEEEDYVLRGLYQATTALIGANPALKEAAGDPDGGNLVDEVFNNGLFKIPTADSPRDAPPPKAKHRTTRRLGFALLTELAKGCEENHRMLCSRVAPHHQASAQPVKRDKYNLPTLARSSAGYVGLKNLGCICYMNASIQNFFMVPEFRRGVLQFQDEEEDKKESLMFQLQRLFAYLQESEKQAYNPKGFCHAFKDWEGNPTNVLVQKDASEFLTMLFQHMEGKLQGTKQEHLLRNCFGGTQVNELIADGHYSDREEALSFLSVTVKNKKNLTEALSDFISGETVDYKWENKDGTKVELATTKRASLKTLPKHLIIHLKRFEFDFDTLQQVKLNDRFEFPRTLDMYPFTIEGRPDKVARPAASKKDDDADADAECDAAGAEEAKADPAGAADGGAEEAKDDDADADASETKAGSEDAVHPRDYYMYQLAGIVIHMGTAQAGHYYSFIRERLADGNLGRWMLFNDSSVSNFTADNIEREAFGGEEEYRMGGYGFSNSATTYTRTLSRNAFVLFYDRVPPPTVSVPKEVPMGASEAAMQGVVRAAGVVSKLLRSHRVRKAQLATRGIVPPTIYSAIWDENMEFWRRRNIFDKDYFDFIWSLVSSAVDTPGDKPEDLVVVPYPASGIANEEEALALGGATMETAKLATNFIIHTLSTSRDKGSMSQWIIKLQAVYSRNMVACVYLLQGLMADQAPLRRFLLESAEEGIRDALAGLVSYVMRCIAKYETPYPDPVEVAPAKPSLTAQSSTTSTASGTLESKTGEDGVEEKLADEAGTPVATYPAKPGRVVITFVETLLGMLPTANRHWRRFHQYFLVLASFASIGPDERGYFVERGVIGQVIDFLLEDESPHPEMNEIITVPRLELRRANSNSSVASTGAVQGPLLPGAASIEDSDLGLTVNGRAVGSVKSRDTQRMGDAYHSPNFTNLFELLKTLLVSSLPPSGVASPEQQEPATPLSDLDKDMVTCPAFLTRVLSELTAVLRVRAFKPLVRHLCWENRDVSAAMATCLGTKIEEVDYDALKPYFRGASLMMQIEDSLQAERVDLVLTAVVDAMETQKLCFKATETSIDLLVKLGKHNSLVRAWLHTNADKWRWCGEWLTTNVRPPYYAYHPQPGTMRLVKPGTVMQSYSQQESNRPAELGHNVERLLAGEEMTYEGYDSDDDPQILMGRRVAMRWKSEKWYFGRIDNYNPNTLQHHVAYDDNDKRWYHMSMRTFHIVVDDAKQTPHGLPPPDEIIVPLHTRGVPVQSAGSATDGADPATASHVHEPDDDEMVDGGDADPDAGADAVDDAPNNDAPAEP